MSWSASPSTPRMPFPATILDLNHDFMLKQMVGTKLDVTKLLAPTAKEATPPLPPAPATP